MPHSEVNSSGSPRLPTTPSQRFRTSHYGSNHDACTPFQSLTPEGLNKLSAILQKSAGDLDLKFKSLKGRLADQRIILTAPLDEIDAMHKAGNLAEAEYIAIRGISEKAIEQVDIDQHIQRRELRQNFDERIWIIESLYLASHCLRLSKKNTDRAELAKICLSNIFLRGRTIRYSYKKCSMSLQIYRRVPIGGAGGS